MTATQRYTGKDLVVYFVYSGGTVVLSGDQTTLDVTWDAQVADLTAGADTFTYEKPMVQKLGATLTAMHTGTGGTATWGQLPVGTEGTLMFGPQGTAVGQPKGGFPGFVQSKSMGIPRDQGVTRQAAFGSQGGTYGTNVFHPDTHQF